MVIVWMCLYFFLLLFESLAMLTTIYLVSFWVDEGVPRMQIRTYLNIYNYYDGKTSLVPTGNLTLMTILMILFLSSMLNTYCPFWAIGGLMFFHLLYMFVFSVNLVCNKAGPIGTY